MTDLPLIRGDSAYLDVLITEPDGQPADLSVVALWWTAKHRTSDADANAVMRKTRVSGGIVLTDAVNGAATVVIDATDWAGYTGTGNLVWDLQMKVPGTPDLIRTVANGRVLVTQDVTRETA